MDSGRNATLKVRTPRGNYCLNNSTPQVAMLYHLKTLAGNCPR